jgi:hypothetical protein
MVCRYGTRFDQQASHTKGCPGEPVNEHVHKKIALIALSCSVFFLPFSIRVCHLSILIFLLNWVAEGRWPEKISALKNHPTVFFLPLFFFIHLVAMAYTESMATGWMKLETKVLFLVFPLALVSSKLIQANEFRLILLSFLAACFGATLICFSHSIWMTYEDVPFVNFGNGGLDTYEALNEGASINWMYFSYIGLSSGIDLHPTYFGIYLISCQLILLFFHVTVYNRPGHTKIRYLLVASFIYFLVFILLLSSRIVIVAELMIVGSTIVYLIRRYGRVAAVAGTAVITAAFAAGLENPVARYRSYQELLATPVGQTPPAMADNSVSIRASLWWLSGKVLSETNVWTGVGTGDTHNSMKTFADRYNTHNVLGSYDPHNQYLYTLISTGIAGLIVLVAGLVTFLVMSWRHKYFICFGFLLVFILTCVTESVLELQKGVVLFTFFTSGFTWLSGKEVNLLNGQL